MEFHGGASGLFGMDLLELVAMAGSTTSSKWLVNDIGDCLRFFFFFFGDCFQMGLGPLGYKVLRIGCVILFFFFEGCVIFLALISSKHRTDRVDFSGYDFGDKNT